eukprot:gene11039-12204_t
MADDLYENITSAQAVQKLFDAVQCGDPRIVVLCLRRISEQGFFNLAPTLLHKATLNGHCKVLKLLLDLKLEHHGANINSLNAQQLTILHVACSEGHLDCTKLLLSKNASVNAVDFDNRTPLYYASHNGHLDCVKEVLAHGANASIARHGGWYPLHEAARFGYLDCMKELIKAGSSISVTTDDAKWTPGHMAASNGQLACLQHLIHEGTDVNAKGGPEGASTLLHEAAHMGHYECVKFLLSSGSDAFELNGSGELALHLATRQAHDKTVELLLQYYNDKGRGSIVNNFPVLPTDEDAILSRNNCLHIASFHDHERCVDVLLRYGALHLMNGAELYPIHIASRNKNVATLRIILAHEGNEILAKLCGHGYNALQYLCMRMHAVDDKAIACTCILLNTAINADFKPAIDDSLCALYLATRNGPIKAPGQIAHRSVALGVFCESCKLSTMSDNDAFGQDVNSSSSSGFSTQ